MKTMLFFILFCLNLSHAQNSAYPYPQPGPGAPPVPPVPGSTPAGSSASPPALSDVENAIINSVNPTNDKRSDPNQPPPPSPKYEEYQSICRINSYDTVAYFSDSTKAKRIEILKERANTEPDSIKPKLWILKEYLDQGNLEEAQKFGLELKKLKLTSVENDYIEAVIAMAKKNPKKARDLLIKITIENPRDTQALKFLGEVYRVDQNYYEASAVYFDLAKITKEKFDDQLCETLTLDAQYSEAEPFCRKSIGLKNPFARIYLGIAAREGQNLKEARRQFAESLKTQDTEMGHICIGEIHALEKKRDDSIASYTRAVKISPKSVRAISALAWSHFENKDRQKAYNFFEKNCRVNRKSVIEVRRALQTLINEKSEFVQKFSDLASRCETLS